MYWQRITDQELPVVLDFLKPIEPVCVNLTSRILDRLPSVRNSVTFMARSGHILKKNRLSPGDILAVVIITASGLFIPAHAPGTKFSPDQITKLLEHVYRSYRRVYCLVGVEGAVRQYEQVLREKIDKRIGYHLMKRNYGMPLPENILKNRMNIRRLTVSDIRQVFQLEKAYQYEEVLVHPERFSPAAHMVHFRRQVNTQTIFFADIDGLAVAKAGTNAIGMNYSQIGGVFTTPEHRGRGIARSLMIELLEDIERSGRGSVLFVKKGNETAIKLYRHLGFQIIDEYMISYTQS